MAHAVSGTLELPIDGAPVTLALRPAIAKLRDAALQWQHAGGGTLVTRPLVDARAWAERPHGEDWLVWRARRTAARLRAMPIGLDPGERIVGRPELRPCTEAEEKRLAVAQPILDAIPPYPGGDAGHFHPDFHKLFRLGVRGIRDEIQSRYKRTRSRKKRTFYQACDRAIQGLTDYANRVADRCEQAAADGYGDDPAEWAERARICRHVATEAPTTFHEALQLMFLASMALWFGEDHGLTSPGRMDQTLRPFYEADLAAGRLTRDEAVELIACLFIHLNRVLHAGSAVAVMVGGRDADGNDVTNELTYLCLAARLATRLIYPTVGLAWHEQTPPELIDFACRLLSTGLGDPAFFNDELISVGLRDHGVAEPDAYNYMNSTCVEIKVVGASNMWVTAPYFNCAQALLDVMGGVAGGDLPEPGTFEELNRQVRDRLAGQVGEAAERLDDVWRRRADTGCFPLASCVISDCLERGQDFDRGGARYNWVENSFVGLANLVDGLVAINHLVYQSNELSLAKFHDILEADYQGHEPLRQRICNRLPTYGNDEDEPDILAVEWADFLSDATESNTVGTHRYVPGFFCWVMHERFGSQTGATPDGRKAGFPLADGAGPAQGRERCGPTASVLSTTKWSHRNALGGLVHNLRLAKELMGTKEGLVGLRAIIETYMRRGGFEIQVNVTSAADLRDAQQHPERHRDLLVRVAGYSDYFVHLNRNMQSEIIARTEHGSA